MNVVLSTWLILVAGLVQISAAEKVDREIEGELYLHCFRPSYGQRVVDPAKPDDGEPATPPANLVSVKVKVGSGFEVIVGDRGSRISGLISKSGDSYEVELEGSFGSGAKYAGAIELEEVFDPVVTWFSGAVFPFRCVFSKRKEVEPFLKAQKILDAKKLQKATESSYPNKDPDAEGKTPESDRR